MKNVDRATMLLKTTSVQIISIGLAVIAFTSRDEALMRGIGFVVGILCIAIGLFRAHRRMSNYLISISPDSWIKAILILLPSVNLFLFVSISALLIVGMMIGMRFEMNMNFILVISILISIVNLYILVQNIITLVKERKLSED